MLSELLHADDLVLMSETIEGLRNKFLKCKEAFESKCLKVSLGETKVVVSDGITNDDLFKSKGGPCRAYCLKVSLWKNQGGGQ